MKFIFNAIRSFRARIATNEKDWPSEYVCKFLEPGVVSYEDVNAGINLLRKEAILKMLPSFKGKPVINNHRDISPENFKEHAVGYVVDAWWDDAAGWAFARMLITDDEAKELIQKGYSVSCAFKVKAPMGPGGEWHAVPYNEEILDGEFEHMAIVLTPRYEDAEILDPASGPSPALMVNSKKAVLKPNKEEKHMGLKQLFFRKKDQKENAKTPVDLEKAFVEVDGERVPVAELMKAHNAKNAQDIDVASDDVFIDANGNEVTVGELVEAHRNSKKRMDDDKKDVDDKKEDDKKDDDDERRDDDKKDEDGDEEKKDGKKKSSKRKKNDDKKDEDEDGDGRRDDDKKDEEPETTEDEETTIKKNNGGRDLKHFKMINSAREKAGLAAGGAMVDMPSDKRARGEKYFG